MSNFKTIKELISSIRPCLITEFRPWKHIITFTVLHSSILIIAQFYDTYVSPSPRHFSQNSRILWPLLQADFQGYSPHAMSSTDVENRRRICRISHRYKGCKSLVKKRNSEAVHLFCIELTDINNQISNLQQTKIILFVYFCEKNQPFSSFSLFFENLSKSEILIIILQFIKESYEKQ